MTMEFREENFSLSLVNEMSELINEHWNEVGNKNEVVCPDLDIYEKTFEIGALKIFTAREDGILRGYSFFIITKHSHYKNSIIAKQDLFFLQKRFRNGWTGYKFIKWCDSKLRDSGVKSIFQSVTKNNDYSKLLLRMGYCMIETVFERRLV